MSLPRTRSTENDSFENTGHFAFVANGVCVRVKKLLKKNTVVERFYEICSIIQPYV
jgi:hypothetical protein